MQACSIHSEIYKIYKYYSPLLGFNLKSEKYQNATVRNSGNFKTNSLCAPDLLISNFYQTQVSNAACGGKAIWKNKS